MAVDEATAVPIFAAVDKASGSDADGKREFTMYTGEMDARKYGTLKRE
jgi:hypothetical protein